MSPLIPSISSPETDFESQTFFPNPYASSPSSAEKTLVVVCKAAAVVLEQWFSTSGGWRPKKRNNTPFGDPFITIILRNTGFGDPKVCDRDPPVEKHCSRLSSSEVFEQKNV